MPHLDKIVDYINDRLQSGNLSRKGFQKGVFYGLAKQVEVESDNGGTQPAIFTLAGNEVDAFLNDTYPFQIYHRIVSTSYGLGPNQGGDGFEDLIETTNVRAVVYGNTRELQVNDNDLAFLLVSGVTMNICKADLGDLPLSQVTVTPAGADFNSKAVFADEYGNGHEYKLGPEDSYFAFNYQVRMVANKRCLACEDNIYASPTCSAAAGTGCTCEEILDLIDACLKSTDSVETVDHQAEYSFDELLGRTPDHILFGSLIINTSQFTLTGTTIKINDPDVELQGGLPMIVYYK